MVAAAIIHQVGKVELQDIWEDRPGVPTRRLRLARITNPIRATIYESAESTTLLSIAHIDLEVHRMYGLSVEFAYWHGSWQDAWAIEELLKWEGREDEIRHDKFYGEFYRPAGRELDLNQQRGEANSRNASDSQSAIEPPRENGNREAQSQSVLTIERSVVFVAHESVHRRDLGTGKNVSRRNDSALQLEQLHGGHATDIS